jgi:hypothetical protein
VKNGLKSKRWLKQKEGYKIFKKDNRYYQDTTVVGPKNIWQNQDTTDLRLQVLFNLMSGKLSSITEENDIPAIGHRYKDLKEDQDKLSSSCPRLPVSEKCIERRYTYYTIEEITYFDYRYCLNETRLPVLWSLHSHRTIWRVSFYQEIRILNDSGWNSNTSYLTARPRNCFQYMFTFSRGTFPIDYYEYHRCAVQPKSLKRTNYITEDPRYFEKCTTS